jgi:hypothetical protein
MNESNLRWIEWTNLLTVAMILSGSAVQVTGFKRSFVRSSIRASHTN